VNEFTIPVPAGYTATNTTTLVLDTGQKTVGVNEGKVLRFRFAVRDPKVFVCTLKSDFPGLDGLKGKFAAVPPPPERAGKPSTVHPNWWGDETDPATALGEYPGAKTISQWRVDYLSDFAARLDRCQAPVGGKSVPSSTNPVKP